MLHEDLSPAETFSTLVHELVHEILHQRADQNPIAVRETQSEAIAFVVSESIGLDTSTAASDYISLYTHDTKAMLQSMEVIQRTAAMLIRELHTELSRSEAQRAA